MCLSVCLSDLSNLSQIFTPTNPIRESYLTLQSQQAGAELCQAQDKLGVACLQLKLKEGVVNKGTNGINLLKQIWSWSSGFG